jgi:ABC-2 type transport system permease protein
VAIYDRSYKGYEGALTAPWSRFLILPRYAYRRLFRSRLFVMFLSLSFVYPLGCASVIYLRHNLKVLETMGISAAEIVPVNEAFFLTFMIVQGFYAFIMSVALGPSLVSPDLVNNGLPLYLCRPFSRAEYVLGKTSVLMILLSAITWVPGLILVVIQSSLEPEWLGAHPRVPLAIVLSALIWIAVLSFLSLSISAYVKRRTLARVILLAIFFIGTGDGGTIAASLQTKWGMIMALGVLIETVWVGLFLPDRTASMAELPLWAAWTTLIGLCAFCLWLLERKLRAYEVVR